MGGAGSNVEGHMDGARQCRVVTDAAVCIGPGDVWAVPRTGQTGQSSESSELADDIKFAPVHATTLALSQVAAESVVRDVDLTMTNIGKRIERREWLTSLLEAISSKDRSRAAEQTIIESTQMACESSVIYLRHNLRAVNVATVAELVLFEVENPRLLVYPLERLRTDLWQLPGASGSSRAERLADDISIRLRRLDPADFDVVTANGERAKLAGLLTGIHNGLLDPTDVTTATQLSLPGEMQPMWVPDQRWVMLSCHMKWTQLTSRRYRVSHRTEYRYSDVVTSSYGRGFLTPCDSLRQRCVDHRLHIVPVPADSSISRDSYGNISSYFHVTEPHCTLTVTSESIVDVYPTPPELFTSGPASAPWEAARPTGRRGVLATEFTLDLNPPEITDEVRQYAAPSFEPQRPLIEVLRDLTTRIYADFTYRSGSTTISTGVNEVLLAREGVCQDFARLAIACLRANGLAASYVSGYLATDPPPGKDRMVGIDVTHAWASVWTPQQSGQCEWLGLDPTNDQLVDERYIVVGQGREDRKSVV